MIILQALIVGSEHGFWFQWQNRGKWYRLKINIYLPSWDWKSHSSSKNRRRRWLLFSKRVYSQAIIRGFESRCPLQTKPQVNSLIMVVCPSCFYRESSGKYFPQTTM